MKNLAAVLTVVLAGVGLAAISQAQIQGSFHDFSNMGTAGGQLCIPCHTPHKADITTTDAPLWNHALTTAQYTLYNSPTFDGKASQSQPGGVSKLCLSCHDGTVAVDSFAGTVGQTMIAVRANVAADGKLNKTHPISFSYTTALSNTDGELADPAALPKGWVNDGKFECSSCHDVHNKQGISKMLNKANAGSALCLTCHTK